MNAPHPILREEAGGGAGGGGSGAAGGAAGAGAAAAAGGAGAVTAGGAGAAAGGAAAAPPPYYKGLYGDDGKIDKAALERLPDHLKGFKELFARADTIDAALTMWGNANGLASKKALTPLDAAAPDHVKAERKAMLDGANNVPKDPKGYGIARPETFPEEHWNQAGADKMAALAHKHSLSPDAVKELLGLQVELTQGEIAKGQQFEAEFFKTQDFEFEKAARASGMDVKRATELATRGAATLGIDPKSPIFKNAAVRTACMRMTALVSEDKLVTGDAAASGPADHRAAARDIMGNPQNPLHKAWNDSADPRHDEAVEKVNQLYRMHK